MADSKITALTALTGANLATTDVFGMVDISDTTMDATGTNKKITADDLAQAPVLRRGRIVDEVHADAGSASSTAEQTLATLALPAGVAVAGDHLRFVAMGDYLNNSGSAVTYTWRFKIGTTTVLTTIAFSVATGANRSKWRADIDVAVGATNAQRVSGNLAMGISAAGTTTWQTSVGAGAAGFAAVGYGTAAEDYTAASNHILTCQLGTSNASADVILHAASLELTKK